MPEKIHIPHRNWMPKCAAKDKYNPYDVFCYACPFRAICSSGESERRCDDYAYDMDDSVEILNLNFQEGRNNSIVSYIGTKIVLADEHGARPNIGSVWKCHVRDFGQYCIAYPIEEVDRDDHACPT